MTDAPLIDDAYLTAETNQVPRKKCCGECLFRRNDPQQLQSHHEWALWEDEWAIGLAVFYCSHTTDKQGRNQVCAGYHALYGRHN